MRHRQLVNGDEQMSMKITRVEFDVEVDDALFARP
jgi:hypothetical protein